MIWRQLKQHRFARRIPIPYTRRMRRWLLEPENRDVEPPVFSEFCGPLREPFNMAVRLEMLWKLRRSRPRRRLATWGAGGVARFGMDFCFMQFGKSKLQTVPAFSLGYASLASYLDFVHALAGSSLATRFLFRVDFPILNRGLLGVCTAGRVRRVHHDDS